MTKITLFPGWLALFALFAFHAAIAAGADSQRPAWQAEKNEGNPIFTTGTACLFPNSDFQSGDWGHWNVVSGDAWVIRPDGCVAAPNNDGVFGVPSLVGGYGAACSDNSPSAVGVVASASFTITRKYITFFTTGWDGHEPGTAPPRNKVELIRAQDDAVLFTAAAPFRNTWGIERWDVSLHQGASVYLKITDANPEPVDGWLGVCQCYGADSDWEDFAVRTPGLLHDALGAVIQRPQGSYWMFYSGESFSNAKRTTLQHLGGASSTDLVHWQKAGKPLIPFGGPGSFDEYQTADPDAVLSGGMVWMFYGGNNRSTPINQPQIDCGKIGLAWCKEDACYADPGAWTKFENPATGNALLTPPMGDNLWGMSVLYDGGRWMMWADHYYEGVGEQIDYYFTDAPTPNTTHWQAGADNPVWSIPDGCGCGQTTGEIGQPSVFKHGENYYMAYHRSCGMGRVNTSIASSPDGIHWKACSEAPLLVGGDGQWDMAQIHMPYAGLLKGECLVFYSGAKVLTCDLNRWGIGTACITNFSSLVAEQK